MIVQTIGGSKRKVFVAFDVERDRQYREFLFNQGRKSDATWYVSHWSQPYDENDPLWVADTSSHIKQAEAVVVLLGPTTFWAPGVLKEVTIAKVLQRFVYQIIPYGAGTPHIIPSTGRVVRWEWETVKRAIATAPTRHGSRSAYAQS
jgi:hypothetical protein